MSEKGSPHVSYTAGFKLKVVLFTKQNGNSAAGRSFSVNEKCVWRWRSQKENLKKMPCSKRARWGKVPNFLNLKKTLLHGLLQRDKKELQYLQL